jgi:hypothetical protein
MYWRATCAKYVCGAAVGDSDSVLTDVVRDGVSYQGVSEAQSLAGREEVCQHKRVGSHGCARQ